MRRRCLAVAVVAAIVLTIAGCGVDRLDTDPLGQGKDGRIEPSSDIGEPDANQDLDPDTVVRAALHDVEDFWTRTFEDVYGEPYEPISGGFLPYGPDDEVIPCGPGLRYEEVAANAFYCPPDDLIAWDEVELTPKLMEQFGPFTLGIVFAHEFGHAIQTRAGVRGPTILLELQADCFAGAWTADVQDGNSSSFTFGSPDDLDASIAGFLDLRDGVGGDARDPNAHGSGFDRIGAFQDGLQNGAEACAAYEDDPPSVFEFGFTDPNDLQAGGNLPFEEVTDLTVTDLESYWAFTFKKRNKTWDPIDDIVAYDPGRDEVRCGDRTLSDEQAKFGAFYCEPDDSVEFDIANLMPELYRIGDFAMGFEIARQYAVSAQIQLGLDTDSTDAALQADCLVGAYVSSTLPFVQDERESQLVASPGDLDEAIIAFLVSSTEGDAFDRIDAFREGVNGFGELKACGL